MPPFLWSLSIFYSNMLKNSSQTIFLAHYYHINLENSPQLNFRIMKRCHFLKDSVHLKYFWTLSADHFPLPAVFFHCWRRFYIPQGNSKINNRHWVTWRPLASVILNPVDCCPEPSCRWRWCSAGSGVNTCCQIRHCFGSPPVTLIIALITRSSQGINFYFLYHTTLQQFIN